MDERIERPNLQAQVEGPMYLGPRTFMKVPGLTETFELDEAEPDVAVLGAPWDDAVCNRVGGRFGPHAVRCANYMTPLWHQDLHVSPFEELKIVDYGDAVCPPGLVEESHAAIKARVTEIAERNIIPIVIGGDHSITYPSASAVAEALSPQRVGIIHFDAHPDTAENIFGNLWSHGTPMRRLIESGAVPGSRFVQIGLRGYWPPPSDWEWMRAQGIRSYMMSEVRERGVLDVVSRALDELVEKTDVIYLSVDIDVLDPGFAPATGTPEPGGMTPAELLSAIRYICLHSNVRAMDLVEVIPAYDVAEITSQNANRCILEAISALAVVARDSREQGNDS